MSITATTNAAQVVAELGKIEGRSFKAVQAAVQVVGERMLKDWKEGAAASSGEHGKHYPRAIEGRMVGVLTYRAAPNESMRQGAMSFERGSRNQPPHPDAHKAFLANRLVAQINIRKAVQDSL